MPGSETMTFAEAVADDEQRANGRSVLLGNGFSIEWNPTIFRYTSLFDEAELTALSTDKESLFGTLGTHDFEKVIEHLKAAADLAELYEARDPELAETLRADAQTVRRGLADVIASRHPLSANAISDPEAESARAFLEPFGRIFTLSYDLLLYWVTNRARGSRYAVHRGDGFQWPTASGPHYLVWKRKAADRGQRVFYLHGGLHLFVEDHRLRKLTYSLAEPLIDQVREHLDAGQYPLVVTEGRADEKRARIERSAYLTYAHRALEELTGTLFIHGMSLSPNDDHVLEALEAKDSRVEALYISIHGDELSHGAQEVMRRGRLIKRRRADNGGMHLDVQFYSAASASVWR